jgi:hypothetical protein
MVDKMTITNRKLCWDCGGEVPVQSKTCPFCGGAFPSDEEREDRHAFGGIYDLSPPSDIPKPAYQIEEERAVIRPRQNLEEEIDQHEQSKFQLLSLSFLLPGISLLILSVVMFFFSSDGYLIIKIAASSTLFVLLFSVLLIYFGIRNYRKIKSI